MGTQPVGFRFFVYFSRWDDVSRFSGGVTFNRKKPPYRSIKPCISIQERSASRRSSNVSGNVVYTNQELIGKETADVCPKGFIPPQDAGSWQSKF